MVSCEKSAGEGGGAGADGGDRAFAYEVSAGVSAARAQVDDPVGMNAYLRRWGIVGGFELQDGLLLAFTEKRAREEIDELVYFMKEYQFGGAS